MYICIKHGTSVQSREPLELRWHTDLSTPDGTLPMNAHAKHKESLYKHATACSPHTSNAGTCLCSTCSVTCIHMSSRSYAHH